VLLRFLLERLLIFFFDFFAFFDISLVIQIDIYIHNKRRKGKQKAIATGGKKTKKVQMQTSNLVVRLPAQRGIGFYFPLLTRE
jgi:hypothetical protein